MLHVHVQIPTDSQKLRPEMWASLAPLFLFERTILTYEPLKQTLTWSLAIGDLTARYGHYFITHSTK